MNLIGISEPPLKGNNVWRKNLKLNGFHQKLQKLLILTIFVNEKVLIFFVLKILKNW